MFYLAEAGPERRFEVSDRQMFFLIGWVCLLISPFYEASYRSFIYSLVGLGFVVISLLEPKGKDRLKNEGGKPEGNNELEK